MLYWYFGTLIVLAALSQIDGVLAIASLLIVPGFILVAANTLLLYSVLLLPFFLRPREMLQKPFKAALAVLPALIVAFGVPQLAQMRRDAFIAQQQQQDFDQGKPAEKVRAITFAVARTADLACNDLCERLLYNREVDKVVRAYWDNSAFQGTPQAFAYHVEKKATCERGPGAPGAYSAGAQARRIAGECIVREPNADPDAVEAAVAEWPLYYSGGQWRDPRESNDRWLFDLTSIETVTLIAGGPRKGRPLVRRTTVVASAAATPLHVTTTNNAFSPALMIATSQAPYSSYVLEQVLKQKLGFQLAEVANP
jgi:hypothetical protein